MRRLGVLAGLMAGFVVSLGAGGAHACGPDTDCRIGDRIYRIALPDAAPGPVGAIVYAHGYRGTATAVMGNRDLRAMAEDEGLALIAIKSLDEDWVIPHAPRHPDTDGAEEFAYVKAVIDDAARRFAIDPGRVVGAGFSAGGMLMWNLACAMPERFAGIIAVAGTFWQGPPARCATPVTSLVHIHGENDPTVPLGGRPIRETWQGDVMDSLAMYRDLGAFKAVQPSEVEGLRCEMWRNAGGDILDFCAHPGGHSLRTGYVRHGLERLRAAGRM